MPGAEVVGDGRARRGRPGRALPRDRPAAGLQADVVGAGAGEQDVAVAGRQRQQPGRRLEQHGRLPDRLARERPVVRRSPTCAVVLGRHRVLEQAHLELDA